MFDVIATTPSEPSPNNFVFSRILPLTVTAPDSIVITSVVPFRNFRPALVI